MIAAAVVRQPYRPTGRFHPWAVGLSHCGSHKLTQKKQRIQSDALFSFGSGKFISLRSASCSLRSRYYSFLIPATT